MTAYHNQPAKSREAEWRDAQGRRSAGGPTLNESVIVLALSEVLWIYKKVTQHSTNGVPTGKTYEAKLADRLGKEHNIPGKEPAVDAVLANVQARAPWGRAGFDEQVKALWKGGAEKMAAVVDERKKKIEAALAARTQPQPPA